MLFRGSSMRVHHTKSDIDPTIVHGIAHAQLDARAKGGAEKNEATSARSARPRAAQTTEGNPAPWSVVQLRDRHAPAHSESNRPGSRTHRPRVEMSKELRERADTVRWTGVKPFAQHSTATKTLVAVPLAALSAAPVPPVPSSGGGGSSGRGVLSVSRLGSPRRQAHFVSPFAAAQAARRAAAQLARREAASPWMLEAPGSAPAHERGREQRMVLHASADAADHDEDGHELIESPAAPSQPLTVPHLPLHLLSPNDLDHSGRDSAEPRAASVTTRVPNAQIIFTNFQRWLAEQRQARQAHEQAAAAVAAAEASAADDARAASKAQRRIQAWEQRTAERAARDCSASNQEASTDARIPPNDDPSAALAAATPAAVASDAANAAPSDTPVDAPASVDPSPETAADVNAEAEASVEADATVDGNPSPADGTFVPTLYSYPRLHFSPPPGAGAGAGASGGGSLKLQAHLAEVSSYPEMQGVWRGFAANLSENNCRAAAGGASDAVVRSRVFAFRIQQTRREAGGTGMRGGAASAEEKGSDSLSSAHVAHGFEDGTDRGSGAKLLHLLQSHDLTNVMLLLTESGGAGGALGGAAAAAPLSASARAFRHACMIRTAKIMIQDYVRIVALAALADSKAVVRRTMEEEPPIPQQQHSQQEHSFPPDHCGWQQTEDEHKQREEHEQRMVLHESRPLEHEREQEHQQAERPAVTLYTLPLLGAAPVPFSSSSGGDVADGFPLSTRSLQRIHAHPPLPVYMCIGEPHSHSPAAPLPLLTAAAEETLRAEMLQLLSGRAYFVMSASNLSRDGGAHRPHFMALWRAFMTLIHCNQEAPDLQYLADRTPWRETERRGFGEAGFAAQVAASEVSAPAAQNGLGGRMCGSMRPDGRAALRLEQKMLSLTQGVDALMLDGFPGDNGRSRTRSRSRSGSRERLTGGGAFRAEEHMQRSGVRGLNLRSGSGFAGSAAPAWKGLASDATGAQSHRGPATTATGPQSRAQRAQAKLASLCAAEEDVSAERISQSLLERHERARRKTLLHTAASVAAAQTAAHGSDSVHSQRAHMDAPGSTAAVWLELQRARSIVPQYRVPSFALLYTQQLQLVYMFKSKMIASRLSRAALRQMADRYDERGGVAFAGPGGAPPFLLRVLLLSVGILLRWRSLHWKGLCHYLRGEVLCTVLSPFLLQDQPGLQAYLRAQDEAGSVLPAPLPAEKLARNVLEREEMEARVAEFERTYLRATRGTGDAAADHGAAAAPPLDPSSAFSGELGGGAPRDLMVHLMSMDVSHMSAQQYTQVRTLFNEPTLTRHHLLALLPPPFQTEALLLFDWILLTMRAYNVWKSCQMAFVEDAHASVDKRQMQQQQQLAMQAHAIAQMQQHQQHQQQQQAQCGSNALSSADAHDMSLSNVGRQAPVHDHSRDHSHDHSHAARVHSDVLDALTESAPLSPPFAPVVPRRPLSSGGSVRPWSANANSRPSSAMRRSLGSGDVGSPQIRAPPPAARNLVSLHGSERPAATHTDELLSGWLMQSATATPRQIATPSHLDDAPSRMMG